MLPGGSTNVVCRTLGIPNDVVDATEHLLALADDWSPRKIDLGRVDERIAKHERRKEKIYKLIAEQPRSGFDIAQAIWGNVAVTQAYLTLSEVIGHADLLLNEGRVREVVDGEVVRYEATG